MRGNGINAGRIAGFGLNSPDAARLVEFYAVAFDARRISTEQLTGPQIGPLGVQGGAQRHLLQLGEQSVDILQFDLPGIPYPHTSSPYSTIFQHFAIVVSDMNLALSQLQCTPDWKAISTSGPQRLPERSGGVTAFKFQDPDGHPLELLEFAARSVPPYWAERLQHGVFLGIDHSAISVSDTEISVAFYESLGFSVIAQTLNHGMEQSNLDGVPDPQVEVTALGVDGSTPHLELLCYRSDSKPSRQVLPCDAVAATRIRLSGDGAGNHGGTDAAGRLIVDPDGHHLYLAS